MEHTGTIRIETERLILRKIEIQDVKDFYELLTDKDVVAQLEFPEYTSIDMATSYINGKLKNKYEREDYYDWGIIEKASGRLVGRICVYKQDDDLRMADLIWYNHNSVRGKGYITESAVAVIKHLQEIGFVRIEAFANVNNEKSIKVMERIGMQYEGTLRKYDRKRDGSLYDAKIYSIIKED